MITKFTISNFKRLDQVEIDLGHSAVFIGPNNSGRTSALQALALWDVGWRRWAEKRYDSRASERSGVVINRRDLNAVPVPSARLLWRDLHTMETSREEGKQKTEKIFIRLRAEGVHHDQPWTCSLDFYYANEESFYCRLVEPSNDRVPYFFSSVFPESAPYPPHLPMTHAPISSAGPRKQIPFRNSIESLVASPFRNSYFQIGGYEGPSFYL